MSRRGSARRIRRRGTLGVIISLLMVSAALRLTGEVGQAIAREGPATSAEQPPETDARDVGPEAAAMSASQGTDTGDLARLLAAFRDREARLAEREAALEDRMAALVLAETEARRRIEEMQAAEEALAATLALADQAAERDLGQLTAVYETMKPKEAAALFEQMDPEFSAGFLGRMAPEAAAGVLAGLSPETAYTISVILAGRNALAPTQ